VLEHLDPTTRVCFALTSKKNAKLAFSLLKRPDHWDYGLFWKGTLLKRLQRNGWFKVSLPN
jgi:hypothetical protein